MALANGSHGDHSMTEQVILANGLVLRVRALRPTDKQKLLDGFSRLSAESRRRRFLGHKNHLSEEELRFFTEADGINHVALAAFEIDRQGQEGNCVAVARFIRTPDDEWLAEVALVVADAYQRLGIGRLLLRRLMTAAADRGIRRMQFYSLADNEPMRRLINGFGAATFRSEGETMRGEFALPAAA
jgi:RimJ/RimL family protein N-acetyltransferase